MQITLAVFSMALLDPANWGNDWLWGLPLIVSTVVIHVLGLGLIGRLVGANLQRIFQYRYPMLGFGLLVGSVTLLATFLHALEASIWALAYRGLDALPDRRHAMLYSLNAITSYGHANLSLVDRWQLLGSLEALNGWLLFGLTTAFLFALIQRIWSWGNRHDGI